MRVKPYWCLTLRALRSRMMLGRDGVVRMMLWNRQTLSIRLRCSSFNVCVEKMTMRNLKFVLQCEDSCWSVQMNTHLIICANAMVYTCGCASVLFIPRVFLFFSARWSSLGTCCAHWCEKLRSICGSGAPLTSPRCVNIHMYTILMQ